MKKLIILAYLCVTTCLFSYTYPSQFADLIKQFYVGKQTIEIIINDKPIVGIVIAALDDYCVFKDNDGEVSIIVYTAIQKVFLL